MIAIMWIKSLIITFVTLALLFSRAHARLSEEDCYFYVNIWWGRCADKVLQSARNKMIHKSDPLRIADTKEGKLEAKDIVIRGLSAYNVNRWEVGTPLLDQLTLTANISWPSLTGDMSLLYPICKKILWMERCTSVTAKTHVTIGKASASMTTELNEVNYSKDGLTIQPSGTSVSLDVSSIRVDAKLSNKLAEFVNWIAGNPVGKTSAEHANNWWRQNKPKLEARARAALDEVFKKEVASELSKVIKF